MKSIPGAYRRVGHVGTVGPHNPSLTLGLENFLPAGASIMARVAEQRTTLLIAVRFCPLLRPRYSPYTRSYLRGCFRSIHNVVMLGKYRGRIMVRISRATLPHSLGVPIERAFWLRAPRSGGTMCAFACAARDRIHNKIYLCALDPVAFLKLINASRSKARSRDRPFTFFQALLFQVVNPKVWAVALAASAGFSIELNIWAVWAVRLFLEFCLINLFVCLFSTTAGHLLAGYLQRPVIWRTFMIGHGQYL